MFCTFVFTVSCKADHCCSTQGLFRGGKWCWHSRCNWSPCKQQHHVFFHTSSDELSSGVDQTSCAEEDQVLLFPVYWWCHHQRESWRFSQAAGENQGPSWRPRHIMLHQGLDSTSPAWYHAYTTLSWLTFWTSHTDQFSCMCVGLTSLSCKKHSSSNSSSHIIFLIVLISSPLTLMTCSSSSHYLHFNRSPSFSISSFTNPFQSSQSASPKYDLRRRISVLWQLYPATYVQWQLPPLLLPLLQQPLVASSTLRWPWPLL